MRGTLRAPLAATALLLLSFASTSGSAQDLNSFGVLAGSTVTNIGPTVISGNVGVSPGSAITGFPPGSVVNGTIHAADAVAGQAQSDLTVLYTLLSGRPTTQDLTGQNLGSRTLGPGVYHLDTIAPLDGVLTLDAAGDPSAIFIFNIGSELITGSGRPSCWSTARKVAMSSSSSAVPRRLARRQRSRGGSWR